MSGEPINIIKSGVSGAMKGKIKTTTISDPAINAAVTTAIIDMYGAVVVTLTVAGNAQTIQDPTDPTINKEFLVANNDTSTDPITVNSVAIAPGNVQKFFWDGSAWSAYAGPAILYGGTASFAGSTGVTVAIGAVLAGTTYQVSIIPTGDSLNVGAIYVDTKTTSNFSVKCTGSGAPSFDWFLIDNN